MSTHTPPTWADMIVEARSLIPSLDPDWTDHNASDPGIALVELLAWLSEMLLYRLEDVPEESLSSFVGLISGQTPPAIDVLDTAIADALAQLRRRERVISPEDHREIIHRLWPTIQGSYPALSRIGIYSHRDLTEGNDDAPGHQSVILIPQEHVQEGSVPVKGTGLSWVFLIGEPGEIVIQPKLPGPTPLSLGLVSPRGVRVVEASIPDTNPCVQLSGDAGDLWIPDLTWAPNGAVTVEMHLEIREIKSATGPFLTLGAGSVGGTFSVTGPTAAGVFTLTCGNTAEGDAPQTLSFSLRPYIGQWIHLALVADPQGLRCYVDGVSIAEGNEGTSGPPVPLTGLRIGGGLNASVCDLRIWRTGRGQGSIDDDRQRRLVGENTSLVGYWPCDEGAGEILANQVDPAITGTISASQWHEGEASVYGAIRYTVSAADVLAGPEWSLILDNTGEEQAAGLVEVASPTSTAVQGFSLAPSAALQRRSQWLLPDTRAVLSFNGGDDQVEVGTLDSSQLTGDLTLELWLRPRSLATKQDILTKAQSGEFSLVLDSNGTLLFRYGTGGDDSLTASQYGRSTSPLVADRWQHIAVVRRAIGDKMAIQFYIDGKRAGSLDRSVMEATPSELPLVIGNGDRGAFLGDMADLRIWTRARLPAELESHRHVSIREAQSGLLACWPMAEGEGDQIIDWSGSNVRGFTSGVSWRQVSQTAGDPPPGTVPGAEGAPLFCGSVTSFNQPEAGTHTVSVASASGVGTLGMVLMRPDGTIAASATGTSPISMAHHLRETDTTPREGWKSAVFQLPAEGDKHLGRSEVIVDLNEDIRGRVKEEILDPRRLLTTRYHVLSPGWVAVDISACLYLLPGTHSPEVRRRGDAALRAHFHPITGGVNNQGWAMGAGIYLSDVYSALEAIEGVDFVIGGPWPEEGAEHDPGATFTLHGDAAQERLDREDGEVVGFSVGAAELVQLGRIRLYTAKKRGQTWYPSE